MKNDSLIKVPGEGRSSYISSGERKETEVILQWRQVGKLRETRQLLNNL